MQVLAAITLLAGASALVPPTQRRSGVALRAGFGAATKKSKAKFVKPGKGQCINQILAARLPLLSSWLHAIDADGVAVCPRLTG